jgi:hypothetical protein
MKTILPLVIAALVSLSSVSMAHAEWKRNSTATGPNGGVITQQGAGSCANGVCSSNQTWTGPNGRQATRQSQTICYQGVCKRAATVTTPAGKQFKRTGTISRY